MIYRAGVAVIFILFLSDSSTAQAYFTDSPHNESNGIYCFMCHNNAALYWTDPHNNTGDIDVTANNTVCLSCHDSDAVAGGFVRKGPVHWLHASSTTNGTQGTDPNAWSTECTDCHDPHLQPQLDWAGSDPAGLWLADGDVDFSVAPQTYNAGDPDGQGYGATTVGISFVDGLAGWTDPLTWASKGGRRDISRAVDNSRGLIFVPVKGALRKETFEIINVVEDIPGFSYVLKVKGQMTSAQDLVQFGVFYGSSIMSSVDYLSPDTTFRALKFFQPEIIVGTYGGWVDDMPGTSNPVGLCQICHTATSWWREDGSLKVHNETVNCGQCHEGGGCGVIASCDAWCTDLIGDRLGNGCGYCHSTIVAAPDSHTTAGCATCHGSIPAIDDNTLPNDGPTTILTALTNAGYSFTGSIGGGPAKRLADSLGRTIDDPLFTVVDCSNCHVPKPAMLAAGTHGGHPATDWDFSAVVEDCVDCHTDGGLGTIEGVHSGDCTLCHVDQSGGNYTRKAGTDGNALLMSGRTGTCTVCHPGATYPKPFIHHDTVPAQAGSCTINCHIVVGHTGDHQTYVVDVAACDNCHTATAPVDGNNVPVDGITGNLVHDACVDCHDTASPIMSMNSPTGSASAMPVGGGNCSVCHTTYFDAHVRVHTVAFDPATDLYVGLPCINCHTNEVENWSNILTRHDNYDGNGTSSCDTCHNATRDTSASGLFSVGLTIPEIINNGGTVNCLDCHIDEGGGGTGH